MTWNDLPSPLACPISLLRSSPPPGMSDSSFKAQCGTASSRKPSPTTQNKSNPTAFYGLGHVFSPKWSGPHCVFRPRVCRGGKPGTHSLQLLVPGPEALPLAGDDGEQGVHLALGEGAAGWC